MLNNVFDSASRPAHTDRLISPLFSRLLRQPKPIKGEQGGNLGTYFYHRSCLFSLQILKCHIPAELRFLLRRERLIAC